MTLSYKELQAALKVFKAEGRTAIKLNAKQSVLQEEYARLTAVTETTGVYETSCPITSQWEGVPVQAKLNDAVESTCYPFNKNTVKVENKPALVLPAMSSSRAPSWLCKPVTVYVVDGVDYLPFELEMNLKGQVCELPAAVNERKLLANQPPRLQEPVLAKRKSKAHPAVPIVNSAKDLPKAELTYSAEPASPYFIDTHHSRFTRTLGTTELQAARNLQDAISATKRGLAAVIDIAKGFHARQVQRARKVA